MNKTVSNERMATFRQSIVQQVNELLAEREDDMLTAWQENIEEAQNNEKDSLPPLALSISAQVDLEKNNITTKLGFTAKYSSQLVATLPDPNQPELPGVTEEESPV